VHERFPRACSAERSVHVRNGAVPPGNADRAASVHGAIVPAPMGTADLVEVSVADERGVVVTARHCKRASGCTKVPSLGERTNAPGHRGALSTGNLRHSAQLDARLAAARSAVVTGCLD
jgi:hypothetical protein